MTNLNNFGKNVSIDYFYYKSFLLSLLIVIKMIIENPNNYIHIGFEKSKSKNKKYDALLKNRENSRIKRVPFGAIGYNQYHDSTGLGLYKSLDTFDKEKRRLYRIRHKGEDKNKYSSGYFSWRFLW